MENNNGELSRVDLACFLENTPTFKNCPKLRETNHHPLKLESSNQEVFNDRGFMLSVVKQDGMKLQYASEELKGDREIVLAAVTKNAEALEYASEELKGIGNLSLLQ